MDNNQNINEISLQYLENIRQEIQREKRTTKVIGFSISIVSMLLLKNIVALMIGFTITLAFETCFTYKKVNDYKIQYKKLVVVDVFKRLFTNITYIPEKGISYNEIKSTNMVDMGNRFYSNDYLSATYNNIHFETSDVNIEEEHTDSEGHTHTVTLFRGQWYIFDFNKMFKSNIEVCSKYFTANKAKGLFSSSNLHKIELEDVDFNNNFVAYSDNDLEAFYILTPSLIQRIKDLKNRINAQIILCFVDNKLHLGVNTGKDLFEPKISEPVNAEKYGNETMQSTRNIINFINDLQLDNDLFRREV